MSFKTNSILWGIVIVLAILYIRSCESNIKIGFGSNDTVDTLDVSTKSDTVYIKGKSDTVLVHDTTIVYNNLIHTVTDTIHDTITGQAILVSETPVKDSLIEGKITSKYIGELKNVSFQYKPLFPKYITRVDTVKINDSTTITLNKPKWGLYVGAIANADTSKFGLSPMLLIKSPKGWMLTGGYDVFLKRYQLGYYTKIPNPFKRK